MKSKENSIDSREIKEKKIYIEKDESEDEEIFKSKNVNNQEIEKEESPVYGINPFSTEYEIKLSMGCFKSEESDNELEIKENSIEEIPYEYSAKELLKMIYEEKIVFEEKKEEFMVGLSKVEHINQLLEEMFLNIRDYCEVY